MNIFRRPALEKVKALLEANGLPTSDLADLGVDNFLGCGDETNPSGVIGLEIIGTDGLLRSLAVSEKARGFGCGKALVSSLEVFAKQKSVQDLYLLTDTAETFFEGLRYERIDREIASDGIRQTKEFMSLCPDDAAVMRKVLKT